ncbi:MAG: hypothetical protein B9S32_10850 [Verrucomicrobia bacterium Tous-C9LFEB]|nr:MAG: hypothetical protein B9S32_10850 [Verrucomicrobia bacterium Tous-C9LFEB]
MNTPQVVPRRRPSFLKGIIACLTLWMGLVLQPGFAAITVVSDSFADGERSTQNLPNSAAWYQLGSATGTVSSTTGYTISPSTAGNAFIAVSYFTPTTVTIGASITLSFSVTDTITPGAASARQGLRFGLFNSNGVTPGNNSLTGDTTTLTNSAFTHYTGYAGFYSLQSALDPSGIAISQRDGVSPALTNSLFGGTSYSTLGALSGSTAAASGTTYNVSLTLQYVSATEMDITLIANGNTVTRTTSSILSTFDSIGLFSSGSNGDVTFDNITVTVVPEPSTVSLLALACFCAIAISRERRRKGAPVLA